MDIYKRRGPRLVSLISLGIAAVIVLSACGVTGAPSASDSTPASLPQAGASAGHTADAPAVAHVVQEGTTVPAQPAGSQQGLPPADEPAAYTPDVAVTLRTTVAEGRLGFMGVGGSIDGVLNPTIQVNVDDVVQVTLINGDGAVHDIVLPDFNTQSEQVKAVEASTTIAFRASRAGDFPYFCSIPGHRQAGMEGVLRVGQAAGPPAPAGPSVVRDPTDVSEPVGDRPAQTVRFDLETVELEGQLADGTSYTYWTFNSTVPGPLLRVRVGDTVEVHLKNLPDSKTIHSIDLHAVTGPGGGAAVMQVPPGEEKAFTFKALNPGLYVYHCATPLVAHHIANGMYGLILVEPEGGLPPVDREFYVVQGEIYTREAFGQQGHQEFDVSKLLDEQPEYLVFNGAVGALSTERPLQAQVGETVRIFFGVGGPNLPSSFHVIGEIFDRVYEQASITAPPLTDVQTTLVPPGGATMVELTLDVPGRYILVDHALSRVERGLVGFMVVEGPDNPDIFKEGIP